MEISVSSLNRKRRRLHSKIVLKSTRKCNTHHQRFYADCFCYINTYLTTLIFSYIEPEHVISNCLFVTKKWREVLLNSDIWQFYEKNYGILSRIAIDHTKLLSERRSKGKVYMAKYLCKCSENKQNFENVIVRKVDLRLTNAGDEDGVPTSSLRDITYLQRIQHPNVIKYYGSQIIDNNLYIVTEFVDYNLNEFVERKHNEYNTRNVCKTVIKRDIMKIMFDLLNAISFMNSKKVFHRNLKPENIFIKSKLEIVESCQCYSYDGLKVGDLSVGRLTGLVKYSPEEQKERDPSFRECKRLLYKAPEIIMRCNSYNESSDLWSIGIIFYELVCNEPLFNVYNEIGLIWEVFKMLGFPKYSKLLNISKGVYKEWNKISLHNEPICLKHIISSTKSTHKHSELKDKYQKTGQLELFEKFVNFCNLMGPDCLSLLFSLTSIIPSNRPSISDILKNQLLWDFECDQKSCVCLENSNKNIFYKKLSIEITDVERECVSILIENTNRVHSYHVLSNRDISPIDTNIHIHDPDISFNLLYRSIVNWYFNASDYLSLSSLTVHNGIHYLLKVVNSWFNIKLSQLVGVIISCIKISHRLNEITQEYYKCNNSSEYVEFVSISADIHSILSFNKRKCAIREIPRRKELICYEKEVLRLLNFRLDYDSLSYLVRDYGNKMPIKSDSSVFKFALLLSDLCLYDMEFIEFNNITKAQIIWLIAIYKFIVKDRGSRMYFETNLSNKGNKWWEDLNKSRMELKEDPMIISSISTQPESLTNESKVGSINDGTAIQNRAIDDYNSVMRIHISQQEMNRYQSQTLENEMKSMYEIMEKVIDYKSQSIWEVIKCVAKIEDIANTKCKKMSINPEKNAAFKIHKIDYDIGGMVNIPVKFVELFVHKEAHPQLKCIAEHILCTNLV